MVDAAIERVAREQKAHDREAHEGEGRALDGRQHEHGASRQTEHALVVPSESGARAGKPTRLRWKGLDVSDEFRNYAERVARGEDLPPFEGSVLAQPNPAFPFGPAPLEREPAPEGPTSPPGRASRVALWTSAALVVAVLGWSLAHSVDTESSAALNDTPSVSVAPLTTTPPAAGTTDGVDTPSSVEAQAVAGTRDPGAADVASSLSDPEHALEAPLSAAGALPSSTEVAASSSEPAVAVAPKPTGSSAPRATIASPLASEQSVTPARAAAPVATPAAPATATTNGVTEDDFGILPAGNEAPVTTPANPPLSGAKSVAPVNGNVGDVARSAQAPGGPARKEPGSESSAKGSLLVETPSF